MLTRLLDRSEWPTKLEGTELETVWPHLPEGAQVVAVENDGVLVACWAVYPLVHVEGVYIKPEYRGNPRVVRHLLRGMTATAQGMGAQTVQTAAVDDQVADFALRLGSVELPGRHFSLRVRQ